MALSLFAFVTERKMKQKIARARLLPLKFIFVSLTRSHTVDCPIYYRFLPSQSTLDQCID